MDRVRFYGLLRPPEPMCLFLHVLVARLGQALNELNPVLPPRCCLLPLVLVVPWAARTRREKAFLVLVDELRGITLHCLPCCSQVVVKFGVQMSCILAAGAAAAVGCYIWGVDVVRWLSQDQLGGERALGGCSARPATHVARDGARADRQEGSGGLRNLVAFSSHMCMLRRGLHSLSACILSFVR